LEEAHKKGDDHEDSENDYGEISEDSSFGGGEWVLDTDLLLNAI
jgi:hypothetical protein